MWTKFLATLIVLLLLAQGVFAETQYNSAGNAVTAEDLLIPGTPRFPLPEKFSQLNSFSVVPVRLPIGRLKAMKFGETINLVLPYDNRHFTVVHDNRYKHPNKDMTWVGYLRETGKSHRVIITFGAKGSIVGRIQTPRGGYLLDTVKKQTYLVDVDSYGSEQIMGQDDQIVAGQSAPLSEKTIDVDTPVVEIPADQLTGPRVNDMIASAKQSAKDRKGDVMFLIRVRAQ